MSDGPIPDEWRAIGLDIVRQMLAAGASPQGAVDAAAEVIRSLIEDGERPASVH